MTIARHALDWARLPGPARLLQAIRVRAEAGRLGPRAVMGEPLEGVERQQVGLMLDARWTASDAPVKVSQLRAGLAVHGVDLEELLEAVGGPLRDLPAERRERRLAHDADREQARALLRDRDPRVPELVIDRCLTASPRLERARQIVRVVDAMTVEGERLAVLAARLFGDAHALDRTRPLGRAVARYLSGAECEQDGDATVWQDPVADSAAWRRVWAVGGVVCDSVSTQVLVLNLPLVGGAPAVTLAGLRGEPVWLTLRSLSGGLTLAEGVEDVFVCENPSIVEAAADRLGVDSLPLVCTFGVPSQAAVELLEALARQATLHVRADGDDTGWRIVRGLLSLPNTALWRMPYGCRAYEEELLDDLLADLQLAAGPRSAQVPTSAE